jgi:uroporphyrin-III C-methyltransferase
VLDELRGLVRLSRVEHPEAVLLSPDQSFFVRENLKLRLLNARLGLLARQLDAARADLTGVAASLHTYFDASSRKTQVAADLLKQLQGQMKTLELPRVDDTLAALTTAAAGR